MIMIEEVKTLRDLARDYFKIINTEKNSENMKLHKAVNDLKQIRPVVLIDELPWSEMNIDNELTLQCKNPYLREIEWLLRSNLYKNKYMPADMILQLYIPINKIIKYSGIGISVEEEILSTDKNSSVASHSFKDVLTTEWDVEKLHNPILTYDKKETLKRFNLIGEILGDIIPVKLVGVSHFTSGPWDDIARYHGVTEILYDLIDRPEFMHKIVQKFVNIDLSRLEQIEALNLFDNNSYDLHCTPILTNDLPSKGFDDDKLTRKDVWGRGFAQIFGSVSKNMHEEFDIEYMKSTIGQCGLVYYGCCEPLDKKIDIVEKIPNLRKISITPWANVEIAAEAINKKYVLSSKPNPAAVAVPMLDKDALKKEISTILNACKKNGCSCDIVLKDISTCGNRPENVFEWEKIVTEMVKSY